MLAVRHSEHTHPRTLAQAGVWSPGASEDPAHRAVAELGGVRPDRGDFRGAPDASRSSAGRVSVSVLPGMLGGEGREKSSEAPVGDMKKQFIVALVVALSAFLGGVAFAEEASEGVKPSPSPSETPSPGDTPTPSPSDGPSPSASVSPSPTRTVTPVPAPDPTVTPGPGPDRSPSSPANPGEVTSGRLGFRVEDTEAMAVDHAGDEPDAAQSPRNPSPAASPVPVSGTPAATPSVTFGPFPSPPRDDTGLWIFVVLVFILLLAPLLLR
jgi:hypothetical protein